MHGGQQLRLFNAHYDDYGFQPIVVFDAEGRFSWRTCRRRCSVRSRRRIMIRPLYGRCRRAVHINASQPSISNKPPVGAEPSTGTSPVSANQ